MRAREPDGGGEAVPGPAPRARAEEIGCVQLPRVHALADGELSAEVAAQARRHVARCPRCRSELAFLRALALAVAQDALAELLGERDGPPS